MPLADSPDGSESVGDSGDDGQLRIRIPNPKVYMARQSQWKGRRGKPRCDHCRLNNLKCDRVLPTCNHCSWASGRKCKYTPLPTPAHRGIPRCDRCRLRNLKCDRNLPVCNHCAEDKETDCNYTPKKRHKGQYGAIPVTESNSAGPSTSAPVSATKEQPTSAHVFEGEIRTEPQIKQYMPPGSPVPYEEEPAMTVDDPGASLERRQNADGTYSMSRKVPLPPLLPKNSPGGQPSAQYSRPFILDQGMIVTTPHIDPWMNHAFVPLPDVVVHALRQLNAIEMPSRHAFEEALVRFVGTLAPELRDTATFIPEAYAQIAQAVGGGHSHALSERMQMWAVCHHARAGSRKRHLLLLPRDAFFRMNRDEEEKLREGYAAVVDGEADVRGEPVADPHFGVLEPSAVFERVPVQPQIFDILVYTHRTHGSAAAMLVDARRLGIATITWPMVEIFIRLCPLCKLRSKNTPRILPEEDPSVSFRPTGPASASASMKR